MLDPVVEGALEAPTTRAVKGIGRTYCDVGPALERELPRLDG